jgi:hypothetical protein
MLHLSSFSFPSWVGSHVLPLLLIEPISYVVANLTIVTSSSASSSSQLVISDELCAVILQAPDLLTKPSFNDHTAANNSNLDMIFITLGIMLASTILAMVGWGRNDAFHEVAVWRRRLYHQFYGSAPLPLPKGDMSSINGMSIIANNSAPMTTNDALIRWHVWVNKYSDTNDTNNNGSHNNDHVDIQMGMPTDDALSSFLLKCRQCPNETIVMVGGRVM